MDQCSENLGEAWEVVYDAVCVACSSCVSVGVCAFVCACVYVCVYMSISYVSGVCLSWSVRLFVCVIHCCVDGVGVFVGMSVRVDIRVFIHVVVNLSIMCLVVCFEVRLRLSRCYCM